MRRASALAIDQNDRDLASVSRSPSRVTRLIEDEAGAGKPPAQGRHLDQVVDPRRAVEVDVDACTAKTSGSPRARRRGMGDAGSADEIRAAALHEADIAAVIDDAGEIGVLEIDANREDKGLTLKAAGRGFGRATLSSS